MLVLYHYAAGGVDDASLPFPGLTKRYFHSTLLPVEYFKDLLMWVYGEESRRGKYHVHKTVAVLKN